MIKYFVCEKCGCKAKVYCGHSDVAIQIANLRHEPRYSTLFTEVPSEEAAMELSDQVVIKLMETKSEFFLRSK